MIVRKMKLEDLEGVYQVEKECFATPWSYESLEKDFISNEMSLYFVAEYQDEVIGYIGSWKVCDEGQITNIAVKNRYRGMGVGYKLLKAAIDELEALGANIFILDVRVGNEAAIALYKKFGFEIAGKRPRYYSDNGEDAYMMLRH